MVDLTSQIPTDANISHHPECYRIGPNFNSADSQHIESALVGQRSIKPYTQDLGDSAHLPAEMTVDIDVRPSHTCYTHLDEPDWVLCSPSSVPDQD